MFNIIRLRLIQIYKNKSIMVLAVLITLVFAALVSSIYSEVEKQEVLDVGVLDEDRTNFSEQVMDNVDKHGLFNQQAVNIDEGIQLLKSNDIELLYVIKEGAQAQVADGNYDDLIDLYFIGDNYLSPLLGDVLVGEMFEEISMEASLKLLKLATYTSDNQDEIIEDALVYADTLKTSIEADKYVLVTFEDISNNRIIDEEVINTNLLYKQMLLGIILAFLGIYILFAGASINRDYEIAMIHKIDISKTSGITIILGHYLGIFIGTMPIVLVFSLINNYYDKGGFIQYLVVYTLFVAAASAMTLLLAVVIPSVSSYIVVGSSIVLIFGIISGSFFNIDLTINSIKTMATLTYTYHGLNQLMDIVVSKQLVELSSYTIFIVIYSLVVLLIVYGIHLLKMNRYLKN